MLAPSDLSLASVARKFVEAGFAPGETIPHDWFRTALGFRTERQIAQENSKDSFKAIVETKREALEFAAAFSRFERYLHKEHGILLDNVYSKGYVIVPREAQIGVIYTDGIGGALRATKTALQKAKCIRASPDNLVEQARVRDATNRLRHVQEAIQNQKKRPLD